MGEKRYRTVVVVLAVTVSILLVTQAVTAALLIKENSSQCSMENSTVLPVLPSTVQLYVPTEDAETCRCDKEEVLHYTLFKEFDCYGNDFIDIITTATPLECAGICDSTEGCVAFAYDTRKSDINYCWCKYRCTHLSRLDNVNTYIKVSGMNHIGCEVFNGKRSCYHLSVTKDTFEAMTNYCKEESMQMVVLETWQEYTFISDLIKRENMKIDIWVSLKNVADSFTWIYPDGNEQLDYGALSPWAPDEPSLDAPDCVYFWSHYLSQWDDQLCSHDFFTICEIMH